MTAKIEIDEKTCQNAEINKLSVWLRALTGKIAIDEKTRQNAENRQTFGLTGKKDWNWWKISSKRWK